MPDDMVDIGGNVERAPQKEWIISLDKGQVEMLPRPALS